MYIKAAYSILTKMKVQTKQIFALQQFRWSKPEQINYRLLYWIGIVGQSCYTVCEIFGEKFSPKNNNTHSAHNNMSTHRISTLRNFFSAVEKKTKFLDNIF